MEHQVSAPLVNRMVPVILATSETYSRIQRDVSDLPAFIYLIESDDASQLAAALAYINALGLSANPLVYYLAPSDGIGYTLAQYSPAEVESARHMLSSVLSVGSVGATPVSVPVALLSDATRYPNLAQAGIALSKKIRYEDLGPLPWFPAWEDEGVRWSLGPEDLPLVPAEEGRARANTKNLAGGA